MRVSYLEWNSKGLANVVKALVLGFASFKVQGLILHGYKQFLGATPLVFCHILNQYTIYSLHCYIPSVDKWSSNIILGPIMELRMHLEITSISSSLYVP